MKVYERLALAFKAEGVTHTFGMMGDGNMHWMNALAELGGVRMLEVRHEGIALGMADGWARETRTPGICTTTSGPGVTQLASALMVAARARSPVVVFCGEYPMRDQDHHQRFDQAAFAAACETGFIRITTPEYADEAVRKAFYLAKTESRPVMLSAPMDVQQATVDDDDAYVPSATLLQPQRLAYPDPRALEAAADMTAGAKKPVIVVGSGAMAAGAGPAVQALGRRIGALIATSLRAKNWMADTEFHAGVSGLYATKTAIELFEEADLVIAVGASMNRHTTEHGYLYPEARYIHLDLQPHVLMGMGRAADCYVQTDARVGVEALDALLAGRGFRQAGYRDDEVRARLASQYEDRGELVIEAGTMDPRLACRALDEAVPPEVGLVLGAGAHAGFSVMNFTRPRAFVHATHFFGCIGQMFPAAMGMIQATGDRPLMLIDGDAATMMHLSDFDTAVRYGMPLLLVVLNDQALGAEYQKMVAQNMNAALSAIPTPDIGDVARALGGRGVLATTVEDVRAAAADWVRQPGPMIIDARISRKAISLKHRRLLYGKDE